MKYFCILFLLISFGYGNNFKDETISDSKYGDRTFLSVGFLDEGYTFVCINGKKWLQKESEDAVELKKVFYYDEEKKRDIHVKCQ